MSQERSQPKNSTTKTRSRAPLNSVSTRIILCVFVATLVTAVIVSWLSINAIHRDVRTRVTEQALALAQSQGLKFQAAYEAASNQLMASTAVGRIWHKELVRYFPGTDDERSRGFVWYSDESRLTLQPRKSRSEIDDLAPPPPALMQHFDSLHFRLSQGPEAPPAPDCVATRIDLADTPTRVGAHVYGCLKQTTLLEILNPSSIDLAGMRLLVADGEGRVTAAAGVRAEARLASQYPLDELGYPAHGKLLDYEDPFGTQLVGILMPVAGTGWILAVETERARAFASAIAITNQIFIVDVWIILLFSVLAYKITLAIMKPIEALSLGARRISEGQVDYQIPTPANDDDELGLLTRTFNDMMRKLRSSQAELERDRIRLAEKNEELQRANEILSQLSITDGLTKLHNHRYFQDYLTREIKRVARTRTPLSLILLDIDDFKLLNDTHGHAAGDEVLVSLASIMTDSARESDLIARYGGEEFVVLMPNTDLAGAVHLAEKIRMAVETTRLIIGDGMKPIEITISAGVALYNGNRREFFSSADRALYEAKAAGKNCVIIASAESSDGA